MYLGWKATNVYIFGKKNIIIVWLLIPKNLIGSLLIGQLKI
jgi:hypothetical protein